MKEFTTTVEDIVAEDEFAAAVAERAEKVQALIDASKAARQESIDAQMADGVTKTKAMKAAPKVLTRAEAEEQVPEVESEDKPVEFLLDGRTMHAYQPTSGQLAFMLASLGRGQTDDGRFAAIINVMLECLRDDDKDYFESRLLTRDPKKRIGMKTIEGVFEYLTEEWFARPTQ